MKAGNIILGWVVTSAVVFAAAPSSPGTINYVEGQVSIDGRSVNSKTIGSTHMNPGSILRTGAGKAEVLLAPGVFFRLGDHSQARLVNGSITDTRIALDRGVAWVEADEIHNENHIQIADSRLTAEIKDDGVYRFDATNSTFSTYDGKLNVREGAEQVEVKKGRQVSGASAVLTPEKFDRDEAKKSDSLYQWSSLRSTYLAEANRPAYPRYFGPGYAWYGPGYGWYGWYGSPYWGGYYSPWRFYGPRYYYYPRYRYFYRR